MIRRVSSAFDIGSGGGSGQSIVSELAGSLGYVLKFSSGALFLAIFGWQKNTRRNFNRCGKQITLSIIKVDNYKKSGR
jgi:hypothetical protein